MNEIVALIQGGLLGIAAINLLFAVWLMYRQVERVTMSSSVAGRPPRPSQPNPAFRPA